MKISCFSKLRGILWKRKFGLWLVWICRKWGEKVFWKGNLKGNGKQVCEETFEI